jgi:iduronate 2-sulfatase
MPLTRRQLLGSAAPALLLGQQPKYNVLFIAADDMNNALGTYGHPVVKSPNIDRLAARGVRFDRAYCQFPLCGPSRCSLLSGLRPDSTQILGNGIAVRDKLPNVVTLPQHFRNNGWHSARFGKMYHMGVPTTVGSNQYDDPPSWDVAVSPPGSENKTAGDQRNITPQVASGGAFQWISFKGDGKDQADTGAADMALETIAKNQNKPFFLAVGFVRPHVPNVAPARFFDLYPKATLKTFQNPPGDRDDIPAASEKLINTRANDMGMSEADKQEALRGYYASISFMDWNLGRVLDGLERAKLAEKTIIVFWGDHGWHLGEHHRWQKRSLFEESARVPLIVSAPGRRARGVGSRALVELVDLYPTLAELGRLPVSPQLEGQSFVPLLDTPNRPWKKAAFTQMSQGAHVGRSLRTERYRYTRWTGDLPDEELYDHQTDPHEFTNLARDPQKNAAALTQMRATLDAGWQKAKA